jgi:NitT/TauT family transport system substrate-binding protein
MPARPLLVASLSALLVAAACGPGASPSPTRTSLTVGLGYTPSVQFAPFYLADQAGYYRDAGIDVSFQNQIDPDLITLVGQGAVDVGVADGTSVIPAVSQGIPIRYIATIYATYPSIVFAKASSGITGPADLRGRTIGIPGRYGSSWIMLQVLLGSAGLTTDDVTITEYPLFGQGVAVQQDAVDAATGFANNEPVQLELAGTDAVVLHVDDVVALPGPGLIAATATLEGKPGPIRAFVTATLRAMREITADPNVGLEAAIRAVPELGSQRDAQAAILDATIAVWSGRLTAEHGLGAIDVDGWLASIELLEGMGLVPNPVDPKELVREDFLPSAS